MKIWSLLITFIVALVLASAIRGYAGNPTIDELNTNYWKDNGPLELSPERGRFALVYSLVEDKSFHFSVPVAQFATPDLGYINNNFVSLFAPGVSYIVIPGYIIGKYLGAAQVGTYAIIALVALLNFILITEITRLLGASTRASMLGALVFLFATPAFAYAVTLYQHHITVFLLLSCIYLLLKFKNSLWPLLLVWFFCALSIVIDYPNLFLFFPIGLYTVARAFKLTKRYKKFIFSIRFRALLTTFTVIVPLAFFLWFNYNSYGNGLQFSGTVQSVQDLTETGEVQYMTAGDEEQTAGPDEDKSSVGFFDTRNMIEGFYVFFMSPDRGSFVFTPIILFGFLGFYYIYSKDKDNATLLVTICLINTVLYSMWGDPHGGWAFGSRYMIPSFAMLGIGCGYLFHEARKNIIFLIIVFPILLYSLAVNSLGAYTSNRVPPEVQVLALEELSGRQERYSYDRALEMLVSGQSKSFVFNTIGKNYMTALQFYLIHVSILAVIAGVLMYGITMDKTKNYAKKQK